MPLVVLVQAAFAKAWSKGFTLDNLTLRNFQFLIFEHQTAKAAMFNSIVYASVAAFAALTLALAVAYIVRRNLLRFGGVLAFLCMVPVVIPGIILAIGFYAAYAPPPLALAGTALIIIVAFTTRLAADRLSEQFGGHALDPSRNGGSRAHPRRRSTDSDPQGCRASAQALLGRRLDPGVHSRLPGTLDRHFPDEPAHARHERLDPGLERGGPAWNRWPRSGGILLVITVIIVAFGFRIVGRDFMLRRA